MLHVRKGIGFSKIAIISALVSSFACVHPCSHALEILKVWSLEHSEFVYRDLGF